MKARTCRTICQFCHANCGVIIHRDGNGGISVEGDSGHPMNRGRLCVKGSAIPEFVLSRDRLKYPLRKTPTGFKKISWDEALKFAAEKLGEIRSKFGPLSLVRCGGAPVSYQARDGFLQFMGEFGSPNMTGAANLCMVPRMTAFRSVMGHIRPEPDYDNTKLILFWGVNPLATERFGAYSAYSGMRQIIPRLKQRGTRIISIDPFCTGTVRQADEWIQLRPGSDLALGLAMIHVIISEELYDREFVEGYASGFEKLKEHVRSCSPEWAESHTGIPAKSTEDLARAYATTKPAAIYEGNGLDMYTNGVDAVRTVAILMALTGNLDVPGGNVFMPFVQQSVLPTKALPVEKRLWHAKFPIFGEVPFPAVKEAILRNDDTRPRAMIVHHSNPVLVQANERRTRRALEKLDFVMVSEIIPTATSEMADLILPIASDFETFGYRAYSSVEGGFLALARPITPPIGEARCVFEVEYELAQRMGFHFDYPFHDAVSWIQFMIKPSGITLEYLDERQIVYATPPLQYRKYIRSGFKTTSGKVEMYSGRFEANGYSPIPSYTEPAGEPLMQRATSREGFHLLGTSRRPSSFVHTKLKNLKALSMLCSEPFAWIHPLDACERDITEGEEVEVTSPQGKITLRAKLTKDTKPGFIWVDFGWGNPTDGKANINVLTDDAPFDSVSGGTPNRLFPCEVKKQYE
jgi:anaerobic selenocysteine-containing dehydrogenase